MYKYIPHITCIQTYINIHTVVPCSILPVATVPLPEMEKVSSIAMMKGFSTSLFGVGILDSTWATEKNAIKQLPNNRVVVNTTSYRFHEFQNSVLSNGGIAPSSSSQSRPPTLKKGHIIDL